MKVIKKGKYVPTRSVIGGVTAQVLRKMKTPEIKSQVYVAAEYVRREAARIARNQIGATDRIVRGYEVEKAPDGFYRVANTARGNNGVALGQAWEQGTGIHFRKRENSPATGEPIKASKYGKKVFAWINTANELPKGKSVYYGGLVSYGEGRVRRNTKGQIRRRRYNPGQYVFAKQIDGFPGTHALEKAAKNMSKVHKWKYTPGIR